MVKKRFQNGPQSNSKTISKEKYPIKLHETHKKKIT